MERRESSEVVVITGASAGVGRACVRAFARPGVGLGLLARGRVGLEAAQTEAIARGATAIIFEVDVADAHGVDEAAAAIEEALGPITIWINNAMVSVFSPVAQMRPEEYQRVTDVTYLGAVYGTLAALRRMRPRNHGVIIQVGSALSERSIPLQSAYCAAKHAMRGFTDSLRCELHYDKSRIHITMVQLPGLNTPQFRWVKSRLGNKAQPVPPIYQPEVAAEAIRWAAYHRRREWYLAWPTVAAMIGNKFAAGFLDRYLAWTNYEAQQTNEPENPRRPDNLWSPLPGDAGAHGVFDARSHSRSPQWELSKRREWLLLAVAVIAAVVWGLG